MDRGDAPTAVLGQLYELADSRDLPAEARGEDGAWRLRMKARHRVPTVRQRPGRASDEDVLALLRACRSARDRLLVLLLARVGLRRGEVVGLRREDIHLGTQQSTDSPQDTPSTARPAKGKRFRVAPQGLRNPSTVAYPSCGVGRAWETWTVNTGPVVRDVHGVGEVEQRRDVTQVALPYVSFRYSYRFSKDALAVTSDSTLRFRSRDEIERSLNDAGFNILDIRDAPDRPRQEYVFITELTSD